MDLVERLKQQARRSPRRIVFPEGGDHRVVAAAAGMVRDGLARPVLLGEMGEVEAVAREANVSLEGIEVLAPRASELLAEFAARYACDRAIREGVAAKVVRKPLSFGGMLLKTGRVEGMVAGVASATTSVIQAATLTVGYAPGVSTPSSFMIAVMPSFNGETGAALVFCDPAVQVCPTPRQLGEMAVVCGRNAAALLGIEPRVALLSFSTKGSANHEMVNKIVEATAVARELAPDMAIDGELQADAALVERVARSKAPASPVAGRANVLVFPDINAGNIAIKLAQYLGGATAIGPVMQGFARPVNDMSRGASVEDLVIVGAITCIQAQAVAEGGTA